MTPSDPSTDSRTDQVVEEWRSARPDLDPSPIRVFAAIAITGRLVEEFYEVSAARHGISGADFFLLSELRRRGEPFECTPGALGTVLVRSTGGMTKQLDRIVAAGYIERVPNPEDRRSSLVHLTPNGRELVDTALEDHFHSEGSLLDQLTAAETEDLVRLSRALGSRLQEWIANGKYLEPTSTQTD